MLREGQREGEVVVLAIDEKAGRVKVNNYGTEMVLTFDTEAPSSPGSPRAIRPSMRLATRMVQNSR